MVRRGRGRVGIVEAVVTEDCAVADELFPRGVVSSVFQRFHLDLLRSRVVSAESSPPVPVASPARPAACRNESAGDSAQPSPNPLDRGEEG